ncbi:MAG: RNA polymerase sigma factor [Lachnospiraceae bacterium]|nr:RNA polymerase sigma factor [Lachnospiraceae bacterium]
MDSSLKMNEEIAEIYERQVDTVYRVCFSFMKNASDAEDMVQETFLKLISCEKQFESPEHEKAWLIVTASNTCRDELRRWKRRLKNIICVSGQENENPADTEDDTILEWVMELPVRYKQVIYLYYYEGYRTPEIANMLHCSESTVRNRLLRGRKILKKRSTYQSKSVFILAAVLAGSLLVTTVAYAVRTYRLHDLSMGKEDVLDLSEPERISEESAIEDIPLIEVDIISLGGIAGSPEYEACSEWREFLNGYDTDGAILSKIGNGFAGLGEEYELVYGCYSEEMADKVDEICEKYGLDKLKGFYWAEDYDDLCSRAEIGNLCGGIPENVKWTFYGGYLYDDGTFHMEGMVIHKDREICVTDYQLMRTMKGSFNPVTLNVWDMEDYIERNYVTKTGESVLLANSSKKALIIAEREKSYIVVNILGDFASDTFDVSDEMLEGLADAFDFSVVP